jgi:hypothetical protein
MPDDRLVDVWSAGVDVLDDRPGPHVESDTQPTLLADPWRYLLLRVTPSGPVTVHGHRLEVVTGGVPVEITVGRQSAGLDLWQAGDGAQAINGALPGLPATPLPVRLGEAQHEVIFYSAHPRQSLHARFPGPGRLDLREEVLEVPAPVGTGSWEVGAVGDRPTTQAAGGDPLRQRVWVVRWTPCESGSDTGVTSVAVGVTAAATQWGGVAGLRPVDASADFGDFFAQVVLGGPGLATRRFGRWYAPQSNTMVADVAEYGEAWTRDTAWCVELSWLLDPAGMATLALQTLDMLDTTRQTGDPGRSPVLGIVRRAHLAARAAGAGEARLLDEWGLDYWDDAASEVLLMAGRVAESFGPEPLAAHLPMLRACADHLLSLRPPGSALPVVTGSWDAQGIIVGIEPYLTAQIVEGLRRYARLLRGTADAGQADRNADRYAGAAAEMVAAARRSWREGGLREDDSGRFVNHVELRPVEERSPRLYNWQRSRPSGEPLVRREYMHYEQILPGWLGLAESAAAARTLDWVDRHWTYATGRAGVTFPPGVQQTFIALLDVCLRHREGVPGADRLLQLAVDTALTGGIPFTEFEFGAYRQPGPLSEDWGFKLYRLYHVGRPWDNSPFVHLVLGLHYGLSHDRRGWAVGDPRPLADYPLTSLRGLRNGDATFDLTWTGRGPVVAVTVDGGDRPDRLLHETQGHHLVVCRSGPVEGRR